MKCRCASKSSSVDLWPPIKQCGDALGIARQWGTVEGRKTTLVLLLCKANRNTVSSSHLNESNSLPFIFVGKNDYRHWIFCLKVLPPSINIMCKLWIENKACIITVLKWCILWAGDWPMSGPPVTMAATTACAMPALEEQAWCRQVFPSPSTACRSLDGGTTDIAGGTDIACDSWTTLMHGRLPYQSIQEYWATL